MSHEPLGKSQGVGPARHRICHTLAFLTRRCSAVSKRSNKRLEDDIYQGTARLPSTKATKSALARLLTDFEYAKRAARYVLGLPVPLDTEDRRILEQVIFPHFLSLPNTQRILFVGCDWYTKHYERAFFRGRDFLTIDVSPKARKFGARNHTIAGLGELDAHFAEGYFDIIFCNGVYGFGLDAAADCEVAFDRCWSRLRDGGYFVLGWDDIPARTPVPLDQIKALSRYQRLPVAELGSWRYTTNTPYRHT
jgi:SAM-dependent methyltransferase